MADRPTLQLGDEFRCKRCEAWHVLVLDPRTFGGGSAASAETVLWFACPQTIGLFYAGKIGEHVYEVDRWRRPR